MTEFELIKRLTAGAPQRAKGLIRGVGDDAAVIACDGKRDLLVTTDALLENIHFKREWTDLETLGRKALAVNLSDIAAMGGTPRFYLVSIGLAASSAASDAEKIYRGMNAVASEHGAILIGGDTVASGLGAVISVTVIGEAKHGRCLYRNGARPGDAVYVTGKLGGSALGLGCLLRGIDSEGARPFIRLHNDPSPRIAEAKKIASTGEASAMIDISDGLVQDLAHIAEESGVGFRIEAHCIPIDGECKRLAVELRLDPLKLALTGGEDYELLFTGPAGMENSWITCIGEIVADKNRRDVIGKNGDILKLDRTGFDHFG